MIFAALKPCDRSRLVQTCAEQAIRDAGLLLKSAAIEMDVPLSLLSEGLKGEKHLSLQRLAKLGPAFLQHFCKRVMAELGGVALTAQERELVVGAAVLGRKHMLKMTTVSAPSERQRA